MKRAAQERRVGRHRPHSKKNQNKILTDADQSSLLLLPLLPPSSPPPPLSLFLLAHTHTHAYWIKMGISQSYTMPTQLLPKIIFHLGLISLRKLCDLILTPQKQLFFPLIRPFFCLRYSPLFERSV